MPGNGSFSRRNPNFETLQGCRVLDGLKPLARAVRIRLVSPRGSRIVRELGPPCGEEDMRRRLVLALAVCLALAATAATALAISFTDVQANNPQIAGDPTSNTTARFPTNKQNEPTIAVNPVN